MGHSFEWSVPRVLSTHELWSLIWQWLCLPALSCVHLCNAHPSNLCVSLWYMIVSYDKNSSYAHSCGFCHMFGAKSCGWGNFSPSSVLACTLSMAIVPAHRGGPCTPLGLISLQWLFGSSFLPSLIPNGNSAPSGAGSGHGRACSTSGSSPLLQQPMSQFRLSQLLSYDPDHPDISFLPQPCIVGCSAKLSPSWQHLLSSFSLVSYDTSLSSAGLGCSAFCSILALSPTLWHSTSQLNISRLLFSIQGSLFSFPLETVSHVLLNCPSQKWDTNPKGQLRYAWLVNFLEANKSSFMFDIP